LAFIIRTYHHARSSLCQSVTIVCEMTVLESLKAIA